MHNRLCRFPSPEPGLRTTESMYLSLSVDSGNSILQQESAHPDVVKKLSLLSKEKDQKIPDGARRYSRLEIGNSPNKKGCLKQTRKESAAGPAWSSPQRAGTLGWRTGRNEKSRQRKGWRAKRIGADAAEEGSSSTFHRLGFLIGRCRNPARCGCDLRLLGRRTDRYCTGDVPVVGSERLR